MNSKIETAPKQYLNLYFQIHQPRRLRKFQFFDIGSGVSYFDDPLNKSILKRIAQDCYLPANRMLLRLIKKYPQVRITFSISGVAIDQFESYAPDVLESFKQLADTGAVEFLGETYYHSLSCLQNEDEFTSQIKQHSQKILDVFDKLPIIFRNTELLYSDTIGKKIYDLGFKGMYMDGIEAVLKGRPVNRIYRHPQSDLVLFPRNYALSDDIAFRYSDRNWNQWPLSAPKFISWLKQTPDDQNFICLGMDYETFGEHQKATGGIFKFLEKIISAVAASDQFRFATPSEAIKVLTPVKNVISTNKIISWADQARDLSAWLGNDMQRDAFDSLNKLRQQIISIDQPSLVDDYRDLQTSDHFYYMSTKKSNDGNVHQYFSPYNSPYEAFMNYMNVLSDLELRVKNATLKYRPSFFAKNPRSKTGKHTPIFIEH